MKKFFKKEKILSIYTKIKDKWFIGLIVAFFEVVAALFDILGIDLSNTFLFDILYKSENDLKLIPKIILIVILMGSFIALIIKFIGDKWFGDSEMLQNRLFKNILNLEIGIRNQIYEDYLDIIQEGHHFNCYKKLIKSNLPYKNRHSRVNSIRRIEEIIKRTIMFLRDRFGFDEEDWINICLITKNKKKGKWEVLYCKNLTENDVTIEELMSQKESMFNCVLQGPGICEFYLDKLDAYNDHKYILSQNETITRLSGSIYCKNLSIYNNNNEMLEGYVLSIGTKNLPFCQNDVFSINLCKKIFQVVESTIKRELITSYLMDHLGLGGDL